MLDLSAKYLTLPSLLIWFIDERLKRELENEWKKLDYLDVGKESGIYSSMKICTRFDKKICNNYNIININIISILLNCF